MQVVIDYSNGERITTTPEQWASVRADGVDRIEVTNRAGTVVFRGKSLYWCRCADGEWRFGGASFYVDSQNPETGFTETHQFERPLPNGVPDLYHDQVKLGWWVK